MKSRPSVSASRSVDMKGLASAGAPVTEADLLVHDASFASLNPRLEAIDRPEAHNPSKFARSAMAADSASCASIRKLSSGAFSSVCSLRPRVFNALVASDVCSFTLTARRLLRYRPSPCERF